MTHSSQFLVMLRSELKLVSKQFLVILVSATVISIVEEIKSISFWMREKKEKYSFSIANFIRFHSKINYLILDEWFKKIYL